MWASGYNRDSELGDGTTTVPYFVHSGTEWGIGGGRSRWTHGTLWASGANGFGQLGLGNTAYRTSFTQVLSGVLAVAARQSHLALQSDGTVWVSHRIQPIRPTGPGRYHQPNHVDPSNAVVHAFLKNNTSRPGIRGSSFIQSRLASSSPLCRVHGARPHIIS